jgi:predicted Zn-dependent protease
VWGKLASAYQTLGVVSAAERTALEANADAVLTWAAQTRARYALSPKAADHAVSPARESEYVESIKQLLGHVYARRFAEAEAAAKAIAGRFPGAPGVPVALCDLEIRRRRFDRARKHCERALATYEGASWAHYLAGLLDKRDRRPATAIDHLRRAIELDPELRHAYQVLAQIYAAEGKRRERDELAETYRERFQQALP